MSQKTAVAPETGDEQATDEQGFTGTYVMLKENWGSNFRRSVRDEEGNILETVEFTPGVPVELTDEQLAAVERDLDKCLLVLDERLIQKLRSKIPTPGEPSSSPVDAAEIDAKREKVEEALASAAEKLRKYDGENRALTEKLTDLASKNASLEAELAKSNEQIETLVASMIAYDEEPAAADSGNETPASETPPAEKPKTTPAKPAAKGKRTAKK